MLTANCITINRISSKQQDEGYSLPQQAKLNKEVAERDGRKVVKEFSIVESAKSSEKRDDFYEAITFLKKNPNVKYAYIEKPDRLTRNLKDIVLVYDLVNNYDKTFVFSRDNFILSKDSNSHAKFQFDIKAILAKNYIDNLSDEVKKGQRGMLEEGRWPGGSTPIGYIKVNKLLIPNDKCSHFIINAFELYATGKYSLSMLKRQLDSEGFVSKNGKKLSKSNYHRLLMNPIYYGMIPWNGKLYPASFQPLINESLFMNVQSMLKRSKNGEVIPYYTKHTFTYQKMFKCGECKSSITSERRTKINKGDGGKHEWIYYRCTHFKPCSQKGVMREESLENQTLEIFNSLQLEKEDVEILKEKLLESHFEQSQYREKILNTINGRLLQIRSNLDEIYDDKLRGVIDEEKFMSKRQELLKEQGSLHKDVEQHKVADKKYVDFGCLVLDTARMASEIYKVRKPEDKRYLLNFIFSNLSMQHGTVQNSFKEIFKLVALRKRSGNVLAIPL